MNAKKYIRLATVVKSGLRARFRSSRCRQPGLWICPRRGCARHDVAQSPASLEIILQSEWTATVVRSRQVSRSTAFTGLLDTFEKKDSLTMSMSTLYLFGRIDGEREYVNQTLSGTGLVAARGHVVPADPLTSAKTATGGQFHSDGRILVLVLAPKTPASATR